MESVIRAFVVYAALLIIFRIAGKRTLSKTTTFDLVLLLIISEAVQQAMVDGDESMTNAMLVVVTLVGIDIVLSLVKRYSPRADRFLEGAPLVLVRQGAPLDDRMRKERIGPEDVMEAARHLQGIARMDDIEYAVLETSGAITIVPRRSK